MPEVWAILSAVSKFTLYVGALLITGLILSRLLLRVDESDFKVTRLGIALAVLGLVAATASFTLRATELTGDMMGAVDTEILGILWETPVGSALAFRVAGFLTLIVALIAGGRFDGIALAGSGLVLWSFTEIGHVSDKGSIWLRLILLMHLVCAAFWVGILHPLQTLSKKPTRLADAADLGHRFGHIAQYAVPALVLAGIALSYSIVGSLNALFTSYGMMLLTKVGLVSLLLGLGAINKLRFVPKMAQGSLEAARHLVTSIRIEWAVFLAALAVTAALTSFVTPPN